MVMTTGEVVGGVVSLTWATPWSLMGPPVETAPLSPGESAGAWKSGAGWVKRQQEEQLTLPVGAAASAPCPPRRACRPSPGPTCGKE